MFSALQSDVDGFGLGGEDAKEHYAELTEASADRCPRLLGTFVKAQEVQYHIETP